MRWSVAKKCETLFDLKSALNRFSHTTPIMSSLFPSSFTLLRAASPWPQSLFRRRRSRPQARSSKGSPAMSTSPSPVTCRKREKKEWVIHKESIYQNQNKTPPKKCITTECEKKMKKKARKREAHTATKATKQQ
jgi:hypothetical protein